VVSPLSSLRPYRGVPAGSARAWYVEGKNIFIESRYAEGRLDRLRDLAPSMGLKVDVMGHGWFRHQPVPPRKPTVTIPIVMALDNDPVLVRVVASLGAAWWEHYWIGDSFP